MTGRSTRVAILNISALISMLSVFILNGTGLIYYDTGGYLHAGDSVFAALGFDAPPERNQPPSPIPGESHQLEAQREDGTALSPLVLPSPADAPSVTADPDLAPSAVDPPDAIVIGSRSALYGFVLNLAARLGSPDLVILLNLAALWLAVWLTVKAVDRAGATAGSGAPASSAEGTAWLLLAGCAGSLPFYIAFLMPDILAPILILALAVLSAYAQVMRGSEIVLVVLLALLAVLAHPSHLLIAALVVPLGALLSPASRGYRLRMFAVLLALTVGLGLVERLAFSRIVTRTQGSQVVDLPFLTARLIDDGPGLDFLAAHCPDLTQPACPLLDSLRRPGGNPGRIDAPVILFSSDPTYGSFRLLRPDEQSAIAEDQVRFAYDVVRERPVDVAVAILRNVEEQLRKSTITMTIPTQEIIDLLVVDGGRVGSSYREGRLVRSDPVWLTPVIWIHAGVYLVSAAGIVILLLRPGRSKLGWALPLMVLAGILANALVCGAISEPADRYGARTMFLLPLLFALLLRDGQGSTTDKPQAS